jgi:uncharacterized RDD family membrane protein YckC
VLLRRAAALLIDVLVLSGIQILLGGVFGVTRVTSGSPIPAAGFGSAAFVTSTALDWPVLLATWIAYFAVFEVAFAATPGKRVVGLRVVYVDGSPARWRALVLRNLLRPLDALPFDYLLGGILVLATGHHQRLGDMAGGTIVASATELAPWQPSRVRLRTVTIAGAAIALVAASLTFDYFGRPPLVIQGMHNTAQLLGPTQGTLAGYRLGDATWGSGTVTYPITYALATGRQCQGSITLRWGGFLEGWDSAYGSVGC